MKVDFEHKYVQEVCENIRPSQTCYPMNSENDVWVIWQMMYLWCHFDRGLKKIRHTHGN